MGKFRRAGGGGMEKGAPPAQLAEPAASDVVPAAQGAQTASVPPGDEVPAGQVVQSAPPWPGSQAA